MTKIIKKTFSERILTEHQEPKHYKPSALRFMVLDALEELGIPPSPDNVICLMRLSRDILAYVSGIKVTNKETF